MLSNVEKALPKLRKMIEEGVLAKGAKSWLLTAELPEGGVLVQHPIDLSKKKGGVFLLTKS